MRLRAAIARPRTRALLLLTVALGATPAGTSPVLAQAPAGRAPAQAQPAQSAPAQTPPAQSQQAPAQPAPAQQAQTPPAPAAPAPAPTQGTAATPEAVSGNPVVARVDGRDIHLDEVREAATQLPEELRGAPPPMLYPLIVDQLIAQQAVVNAARAAGLQDDPEVRRRVLRAEDSELQQAFLRREVAPAITDEALRARFESQSAARPAEEEVHARHILVPTEAEARAALEEARRPGADFAAIARRRSTGPGAQEGGDLGFFKKSDMIPEFAEAAFALRPGQISSAPVRSPFGWHVIKVEERRAATPPNFEEARDGLRQAAFEEAVNAAVERVRAAARIERFNLDGSPVRGPSPLDGATPPPPATAPRR